MKRETSIAKKEMILDGALALFKQKGFTAVSTRDLAEYTGLSRSHIYHYFSDWKALCLSAFERFIHQELDEIQHIVAPLSPKEALSTLLRYNLPDSQDAAWTLYIDLWNISLYDTDFAACYLAGIHDLDAVLTDILRTGAEQGIFKIDDVECRTRQISSITNGYADDLMLSPSHDDAEKAFGEIMDVVTCLIYS